MAKLTIKDLGKVNEAIFQLSKIPNINNGGCGVSALALAEYIENNEDCSGGHKPRFVFLYHYHNDDLYSNNTKAQFDSKLIPKAPAHIVVLWKGLYIDSDGEHDITNYQYVQFINKKDFLIKAIKNINSWNRCFNRSNIKQVKEALGVNLTDV